LRNLFHLNKKKRNKEEKLAYYIDKRGQDTANRTLPVLVMISLLLWLVCGVKEEVPGNRRFLFAFMVCDSLVQSRFLFSIKTFGKLYFIDCYLTALRIYTTQVRIHGRAEGKKDRAR